jgi:ABC-type bacteriocin/lantibiotic exporter with double-glycine peptidase domain
MLNVVGVITMLQLLMSVIVQLFIYKYLWKTRRPSLVIIFFFLLIPAKLFV